MDIQNMTKEELLVESIRCEEQQRELADMRKRIMDDWTEQDYSMGQQYREMDELRMHEISPKIRGIIDEGQLQIQNAKKQSLDMLQSIEEESRKKEMEMNMKIEDIQIQLRKSEQEVEKI